MLKLTDVAEENAQGAARADEKAAAAPLAAGVGSLAGGAAAAAGGEGELAAKRVPGAMGEAEAAGGPVVGAGGGMEMGRGGRSTLGQKVALGWQAVAMLWGLAYCLRSPVAEFRRLAWVGAGAAAVILGVALWSHFWARPFAGGAKREQGGPHFSPHVFLGLILVFLGTVNLTLYYAGVKMGDAVMWQTATWAPVSLPVQTAVVLGYGVATIALGILVRRRTVG